MDGAGGWQACWANPGGIGHISEDVGTLAECEVETLMILNTVIQVRSSENGRAGIGHSSGKGLNTEHHKRLQFNVHAASMLHSMVLQLHRWLSGVARLLNPWKVNLCLPQLPQLQGLEVG